MPFQRLALPFQPYLHQYQAFLRLSGGARRSTLVATGTGSGKTECFLYPALDYCANSQQRGVKVIIIYPMNALAADQARRIAAFVHENEALRGRVSVGLFTGDQDRSPHTNMAKDHVIHCKETQRENPPDILLTNYKMLDFLLVRPKDQRLWRHNAPGTLKYLVVDELHTFDGAQGTDLACLVRRLRDRLEAGNDLACVGTSATVGDEAAQQELVDYASEVFATRFDADSIIREDRLNPGEFLPDESNPSHWPVAEYELSQLDPDEFKDPARYLVQIARAWFPDWDGVRGLGKRQNAARRVELAERLLRHAAFRQLLEAVHERGLIDLGELAREWQQRLSLPSRDDAEAVLSSLLALVSAARVWRNPEAARLALQSGSRDVPASSLAQAPFLQVRLQLWLRELRRMVASVSAEPKLVHADDLKQMLPPLHLPVVGCRECNLMAWLTVKDPQAHHVVHDLPQIYRHYFARHPDSRFLIPAGHDTSAPVQYLCPNCGHLSPGKSSDTCNSCQQSGVVRVQIPNLVGKVERGGVIREQRRDECPSCRSRDSIYILGYRAVTLASALLGRMMHSPYNDDRKLIAFSDSVQDAAHRAGFFTSRTYGRMVRTAIHGYLRDADGEVTLQELVEELGPHWHRQAGNDADFSGAFMPPNLIWWNDYQHLLEHENLPQDSDLAEQLMLRLGWEAVAQFGTGARRGGSLEKNGACAAMPDPLRLQPALPRIISGVQGAADEFAGLSDASIRQWIYGMLWRMRIRGGIAHDAMDALVTQYGGRTYPLRKSHPYMPYFPKHGGPTFVTLSRGIQGFEQIGQEHSWYAAWFAKCSGEDSPFAASLSAQAHAIALRELTRARVLRGWHFQEAEVWGLEPEAIRCGCDVSSLSCDTCGFRVHLLQDGIEDMQGIPCVQVQCRGRMQPAPALTGQGEQLGTRPHRTVASEHTSLLEPDTRRRVERSFISGMHPWDVNVLSATPTLEMGVDIGDLSSVLLCSTPPRQANYLQRIGRAGRRDGNALAINIAAGSPHDLHFYADPERMMSGPVHPPGVFLKARAVLERQLLAYSLDRWAQALEEGQTGLPERMREVLDAVDTQAAPEERFPYSWFKFLQEQGEQILDSFLGMFPEVPEDVAGHLRQYLLGGGEVEMAIYQVANLLEAAARRRRESQANSDALKRRLQELEKGPQDETTAESIDAIHAERSALSRARSTLNRKHVLNFFTDEGLLPNYAFPEEGVELESVIVKRTRRKDVGGDSAVRAMTETFSYQRAASTALSEFAPESWFYASGRKVRIEQIDLAESPLQDWRFCDQCHHAQPVGADEELSTCPRCGSAMWCNVSQKRTAVRLKQVIAHSMDDASLIGDDNEVREPQFFSRQLLVDVPRIGASNAYRIQSDELPFAFEYLPKVSLRDINFGPGGQAMEPSRIAGREEARSGFRICKHCGKLDAKWVKFKHSLTCPMQRLSTPDQDAYIAVDLLRELNSEAVRILLPVITSGNTDNTLHSLIAAIELGLRKYFRGNVDHLRLEPYSDQSQGSPRNFLLIYDTVPGGTGYLKDLMAKPQILIRMLQTSLTSLQSCECVSHPESDGCYECVYAYRNSRNRHAISRRKAEELLTRIIDASKDLQPIASVDDVDTNCLLESEFERRFIAELSGLQPRIQIRKSLVDGKPGYELWASSGETKLLWEAIPQVELGKRQGICRETRADLVLRPVRSDQKILPIAVYVDGFGYHWNSADQDAAKRQAVWDSGDYRVWTLAWNDLPSAGGAASSESVQFLNRPENQPNPFEGSVKRLKLDGVNYQRCSNTISAGPFEWLIQYLCDPKGTADRLTQAAASRVRGWLDRDTSKAEHPKMTSLALELQENAAAPIVERFCDNWQPMLRGGIMNTFTGQHASVEVTVGTTLEQLKGELREGAVHICLDDTAAEANGQFEKAWRSFWAAANLFQFIEQFTIATRKGVLAGLYNELGIQGAGSADQQIRPGDSEEWREASKLSDLVEFIQPLASRGVGVPEVGIDLEGEDRAVIGQLELAWISEKVGVVEDANEIAPAESAGWSVISTEDPDWVEQVAKLLGADA